MLCCGAARAVRSAHRRRRRRYGADGAHAGNMTNIPDDVSNLNCGVLPDGRIYLLSNVRGSSGGIGARAAI